MADDDRVKELASHMEGLVYLLEKRDAEQGKRWERLEVSMKSLARNLNPSSSAIERAKMPVTPASLVATVSPLQYGDTSSAAPM